MIKRIEAALICASLAICSLSCDAYDLSDEHQGPKRFSFERYAVAAIKPIESNPDFLRVALSLEYDSGGGEVAVFVAEKAPDLQTLADMSYEEAFILPTREKVGYLVEMLAVGPDDEKSLLIDDVFEVQGVHYGARHVYVSLVSFPDEGDDTAVAAGISVLEMGDDIVNGEPDIDLTDLQ